MGLKQDTNLAPPLFEQGHAEEFISSGRTLAATFSPRDESLAVFASNNVDPQSLKRAYPDEQPVYFAATHPIPVAERRTFISDTSVIFSAVQEIDRAEANPNIYIKDNRPDVIHKLADDYITHAKEVWVYVTREASKGRPQQYSSNHYRILYSCVTLFATLYAPGTTADRQPVGDDLLEWLNTHYVEPSSEEGMQLSAESEPWQNEAFWPYLIRATLRGLSKAASFFLEILASKHPSPHLKRLSTSLAHTLSNQPRLRQFTAESEFSTAHRRWVKNVRALRLDLDRVPEEGRDDGFDNWWDRMSDIVGILEGGREDLIKRVCHEVGADWKEVVAVWGVFVNTRLIRANLPQIVPQILDELPTDPTDLEDAIQSALLLGEPVQALEYAAKFDIWLAAHLADLMQELGLLENHDHNSDSEVSLRDYYVLQYAEYMRLDPSCWRHTVTYLYTCGEIGHQMADQVLLRVALRLKAPKDSDADNEASARIRAGVLDGVLKEINETCYQYKREAVRRTICRIAAQTFLQEKNYGLAISYCASAEDWSGLARIVDRVLDEYILQGPASFASKASGIAKDLQSLRSEFNSNLNGVFIHRLQFAVRFAEFHQRRINGELEDAALDIIEIFREEIVPTSWWAVVLVDALELLQNNEVMLFTSEDAYLLMHRVEEIALQTSQGFGSDYLTVLARVVKNGDEKLALQRLQIVRLALTRYYARCGVIGVGGKVSK